MCKDAWVSVKSRFRKLNPYATHLAYQVLRSLGVLQNDLSQMQFTKREYQYILLIYFFSFI